MIKDTEYAQNLLNRMLNEICLNITNPNIKLKRQYHKAYSALADAAFEFDILNSMKVELKELDKE